MYRFYIEENQIGQDHIVVTGSDVNHIANVLRMQTGEWVVLCDAKGKDYVCRIESCSKEEVLCHIEKVQDTVTELSGKIYLFQALPKQDKMEWIIQKAVELGVHQVIPVKTKRCVVKLSEEKKIQKKQKRWQEIAQAAAKQSDRGIIPEVKSPMTFAKALEYAKDLSYNLIPYELADGIEESRKIISEAATKDTIGIFIGPEGGFEEEEVKAAMEAGCKSITLGKRILRTETAGMTVMSILMFQMQ